MAGKAAAIAVLKGDAGESCVVNLLEQNGETTIRATCSKLKPGKHGFHVHEFGNLSEGCASAGPHYNPFSKTHGGPADEERHVGDLGNIIAGQDGTASFTITDKLIKVTGPYSVVGRAIVLHADEDDLGRGNQSDSKTTGHAGARVACGVIGLTKTE